MLPLLGVGGFSGAVNRRLEQLLLLLELLVGCLALLGHKPVELLATRELMLVLGDLVVLATRLLYLGLPTHHTWLIQKKRHKGTLQIIFRPSRLCLPTRNFPSK